MSPLVTTFSSTGDLNRASANTICLPGVYTIEYVYAIIFRRNRCTLVGNFDNFLLPYTAENGLWSVSTTKLSPAN